jgi:hypothetical protein
MDPCIREGDDPFSVIPAQAGIHLISALKMDLRNREGDELFSREHIAKQKATLDPGCRITLATPIVRTRKKPPLLSRTEVAVLARITDSQ